MNLKRSSTTFLKVIIFLAGISVLALCIFLVRKWRISQQICILILLRWNILFSLWCMEQLCLLRCSLSGFQSFTVHWWEHSVLGIISKGVKEYKALCNYNQWFVCIKFATFYFIAKKMDPPIGLVGLIIVLLRSLSPFCCYPPTTSTRGNSHKIRKWFDGLRWRIWQSLLILTSC